MCIVLWVHTNVWSRNSNLQWRVAHLPAYTRAVVCFHKWSSQLTLKNPVYSHEKHPEKPWNLFLLFLRGPVLCCRFASQILMSVKTPWTTTVHCWKSAWTCSMARVSSVTVALVTCVSMASVKVRGREVKVQLQGSIAFLNDLAKTYIPSFCILRVLTDMVTTNVWLFSCTEESDVCCFSCSCQ